MAKESKFKKLQGKVAKEYEKKGDSKKESKEIGAKVAGKIKAEKREDAYGRRK